MVQTTGSWSRDPLLISFSCLRLVLLALPSVGHLEPQLFCLVATLELWLLTPFLSLTISFELKCFAAPLDSWAPRFLRWRCHSSMRSCTYLPVISLALQCYQPFHLSLLSYVFLLSHRESNATQSPSPLLPFSHILPFPSVLFLPSSSACLGSKFRQCHLSF